MYVEKKNVKLDIYCILRTIQLMFDIVVLKKKSFPYTKYEKMAMKKTEEVVIRNFEQLETKIRIVGNGQ